MKIPDIECHDIEKNDEAPPCLLALLLVEIGYID